MTEPIKMIIIPEAHLSKVWKLLKEVDNLDDLNWSMYDEIMECTELVEQALNQDTQLTLFKES